MVDRDVLQQQLRASAAEADALRERASRLLVSAVIAGHRAGISQREIGEAIGRSQPEVSRLLRFRGSTPLGHRLADRRPAVLSAIRAAGGRNPLVFGSVARGDDDEDSDVDLLIELPENLSLFALGRLEQELSRIVEAPVDVVPAGNVWEHIRDRALSEAVPL